MRDHGETTVFHIRGTDPANSEQVVYECVGFPRAHAKAAELRMFPAEYKNGIFIAQHGS